MECFYDSTDSLSQRSVFTIAALCEVPCHNWSCYNATRLSVCDVLAIDIPKVYIDRIVSWTNVGPTSGRQSLGLRLGNLHCCLGYGKNEEWSICLLNYLYAQCEPSPYPACATLFYIDSTMTEIDGVLAPENFGNDRSNQYNIGGLIILK